MSQPDGVGRPLRRPLWRRALDLYARSMRWIAPLVIAVWIGGAVCALIFIPPLSPTGQRAGIGASVSTKSKVIQTEIHEVRIFGFPLLAQNVVVQHRPGGLSLPAQLNTVRSAVALDKNGPPRGLQSIAAAVPLTNAAKLVPSSRQQGTTALTYLFYHPSVHPSSTAQTSSAYAKRYLSSPADALVGVTGAYPAEAAQGKAISGSLLMVEIISVGLLLLIVGLTFRSVVAPALTLFTAGMAYELSRRLLSLATIHIGISVPAELDPIIVVLLLGIVTDYSVFYFSALRRRLRSDGGRLQASRLSNVEVTPLVLAAGVTVAGSVSMIATAHLQLFAELAPGLAITVAVSVAVVVTFVPAYMTVLGSRCLWPSASRGEHEAKRRRRLQSALTDRRLGVPVLVVAVGALVALALPLGGVHIGTNLISDLGSSSEVATAAQAAASGFAPGIIEPTTMLVQAPPRGGQARAGSLGELDELQNLMASQPGVAGVIGPADLPPQIPDRIFVAPHGGAARYLVILDARPLGASAVHDLGRLEEAMPRLAARSGLAGWSAAPAGDTAISRSVTNSSRSDLLRVGLLTVAVDFLMTLLLLRSLIAPLLLTLGSILVVAAALGITVLVFPGTAGTYGFTFYVPFATEVLLLSFGADYNMFLSGEIWEQTQRRPFRDAVAWGGTRAGRAINIAGITLALSFSVLAVVPLTPFRQIAVAMAVGLVVDTFVVRFLVIPATLSLIGPASKWPELRRRRARPGPASGGGDGSRRTGVGEHRS